MSSTLNKQDIVENFQGCIHCSQVVVKQWAEKLGLDEQTAMRMAGPLGGGCFGGDICGSVTGALLVIGAALGHCELGDAEGNAQMVEKVNEFKKRFAEENGSLICRDLTGYDFSKEGELEKALEAGTLFDKCPCYVNSALAILDDIL